MAGHSKWANIKHRKEKMDSLRGKVFTKLAREIMVAARLGGGDPEANPRLKAAIARAREANIPNENIQRAIMKGTGELAAESYEEVFYEGYGPGGVAILLKIMTDNRNRTAGEIRHLFSKHGGSMGEAGSVQWIFEEKGYITIPKEDNPGINEEEILLLVLDAGAEDLKDEGDQFEVITAPEAFEKVKDALNNASIKTSIAEITMLPKTTVPVSGEEAQKLLKLLDLFEEHDDVQEVYANFELVD
ncbi:YebC/PmpR family DNA-binding transcriptional regulator [Carboxydothermus ferrireducens]|uniref:Probable transcriptional regulatory protein HDG70_002047 n=1 Tax=Carboxydothermus ferrireducens DSM 11255 TaxID=1119529 RepID=A0ABX2RAT3_9THEO|nr:YebC/PmpR family DNA-binding transcriptional regulator [Carboxydothermus ferrireducens]NYE58296.1 YebC/PmpR family DNA-binding regulatory protein [Carboxydothermus ferrireducens DSM 11255]